MKLSFKILLIDLLLFLFCIPGIVQVINKADIPFKVSQKSDQLILVSDYDVFRKNDILVSLDGYNIKNSDQLEFLTDTKSPSQIVNIKIQRNAAVIDTYVKLTNFYDLTYVITAVFIGISFFLVGIIVLLKGTERGASIVFHWAAVSTALILFCTWGNINILPYGLGYAVRYVFHAGYVLAPVLFVHFGLLFPFNRIDQRKPLLYFCYSLAVLLFLYLSYTFTIAAAETLPTHISDYLNATDMLRLFIISGVLLSVVIFSRSYLFAQSLSQKKKLKWILYGFFAGPLTYILTWVLPQVLSFSLIPETAAILFMLSVPLSFAIAILKYHLLDIDIVINKSIVYFTSIAVLVLVYFSIVFLVSDLITGSGNKISSVISVVTVVILFQPLKNKVQHFVDVKFFRVQYNFREAVRKFFRDMEQINDYKSLSEFVVNETDKIIPLKESGIVLYDPVNKFITHLHHNGFFTLDQEGALYKLQQFLVRVTEPSAHMSKVENWTDINSAEPELFTNFGITIIIPLMTDKQIISGYFLIGHKKSGAKFTLEDIELLKMIGMRATLEISRIRLNQKLVYEQLQTEKLQELDKLKSFFISSTAHELKTPLTSIGLLSEMLERNSDEFQKEYLHSIKGECARLTRLIDNLLDISRIERKEKKYSLKPQNPEPLVRKSLLLMEYQFIIENCTVKFSPNEGVHLILADEDAVISALMNIYTNGIKYSRDPKELEIKISHKEESVFISITDNGIGINEKDIGNILQPYYRSTLVQNSNFIGTGIGLALVKHIMEGHHGKIDIQSTPGKGSTFTLEFPLYKEENYKKREDHKMM